MPVQLDPLSVLYCHPVIATSPPSVAEVSSSLPLPVPAPTVGLLGFFGRVAYDEALASDSEQPLSLYAAKV